MRKLQMLFLSFSLILNMGVVNAGSDVPFSPAEEVVETLPVESESTEVIVETATSAPTTIEQDVEESLPLESPTVEIDEEESTTIETQPLETEPIEEVDEEIITNEEDIEVESSEKTVNFTKASKLLPPIKGPIVRKQSFMNDDSDGIELAKNAVLNTDDYTVDFTLEAFVTGSVQTVISEIPADIVLVLDQSGSMSDTFETITTCEPVSNTFTNSEAYDNRGALRIVVDGTTYELSVVRQLGGGQNRTYTYTYGPRGNRQTVYLNGNDTFVQPGFVGYGTVCLYSEVNKSRLDVLKEVVSDFVNRVALKAKGADGTIDTDDDVNHQISIVGFASGDTNGQRYENTEVLTVPSGDPIGYTTANNNLNHYKNSLLSVNNQFNRITTAIDWLDHNGATRSDLGMDMAKKVLEQNPVPANEERQQVVIMFTDGTPTTLNTFSEFVANGAIGHSKKMKDVGTTVFTIGIFDGANPDGTNLENRYMNYVSSNFPNAEKMDTSGSKVEGVNYYLSADNPQSLADIFISISQQIGGTSVSASEETVVMDMLAPQLELPSGFSADNVSYKIYDYKGNGNDFDSSDAWEISTVQDSVTINVTDSNKIEVTGFDYEEHYVAYDSVAEVPRGKKIVIKFTASVKEDFIGGNLVITNDESSGFYLPDENQPTESFELPTINVPLRFNVVKEDAGQYYGTATPANQLIVSDSMDFQIGDTTYTFDGINNKYVDVTYEVFDSDDNPIYTYSIPAGETDINKDELEILLQLEETGTLTYKATVTPSFDGDIPLLSVSTQPKLYVWYPEFELTNETIYLGETTNLDDRYTLVKWYARETGAIAPNYDIREDDFDYQLTWVSGTQPVAGEDYKPSVDSTFRIAPMIKKYQGCEGEGCWVSVVHPTHTVFDSENSEKQTFTIFVETLKLTIIKSVVDNDLDPNQSFVFYITADNGYEKTIVIQGNGSVSLVGLPIGTYTVEEDTDWSYRYDTNSAIQETTLSRSKQKDEITVVNTIKPDVPWLSGEHYVINRYEKEEEVKD